MKTAGSARRHAADLLAATGMPADRAERSAEAIVLADVWGVPSHGMMRLPYYLERLVAGGYQPAAELHTVRDTGPLVAYAGNGGLGHWQLWQAAEIAASRSASYGIAAVSVADSGHCGALGVYTLPMVHAGQVGLAFSNGPAVMPPWGGTAPVLSTSPLAFGIPGEPPSIVDLATSAVARGKIAQHARSGTELSPGWAFDADGRPTTDAAAALHGMLAPLGGAKGFALAFAVEALTAGLVGPSRSAEVVDMFRPDDAAKRQGISHLVLALSPELCSPAGDPADRLSALAASVREAGGRVPGQRRVDPRRVPDDHPLAIDPTVVDDLSAWADRLGVAADL